MAIRKTSKQIKIPYYDKVITEDKQERQVINRSVEPIDFGSNRVKQELKELQKQRKFYTRQAKRNSTKQFI